MTTLTAHRHLLTAFLLCGPLLGESSAQWDLHFDGTVPVSASGTVLDLAWAGGLNFVQAGSIDLDGDGQKDLILFDRTGNKVVTLMNSGATGVVGYRLTRDYDTVWPFNELHDWLLVRDFNCDGKEDLFSYSQAGFSVYKNISDASGPAFALETFRVNSRYVAPSGASSVANLFVSQVDLPGIVDVDSDGDLDILTFSLLGSYMEYHKNLSMELYGTCDSLTFELRNNCWGAFVENFNNNSVTLNSPCNFNVPVPEVDPGPGEGMLLERTALEGDAKAHAGSSVTPLDLNGDGVMDLLLGDISYQNVVALYNGGTVTQSLMVTEDTLFPSYNTSVDLAIFPGAHYLDLNGDGKRDLLCSPNATSLAQNYASMWFYENVGEDASPVFEKRTEDLFQSRMLEFGEGAYPVPFDHNGDGLMDLLVANFGYHRPGGVYEGAIALLENTGSASNPAFELVTTDYMDLSTSGIGNSMHPALGDLDGDGDQDMVIGDLQGRLHFYRNVSTGPVAQFTLMQPNILNSLGEVIDVGQYATPQLLDMNGDGLLDLVIGERNGNLNYYRNSGNASAAAWTSESELLGGVQVAEWWNVTGHSVPFFFQNDAGERELLVGSEAGWIHHFNGIDGNLNGTWNLVDSTFLGLYDGPRTGVCLHDFTGDGELDLVLGNFRGGLSFWRSDLVSTVISQRSGTDAFTLAPNPATDRVDLLVTGHPAVGEWLIVNAMGQVVHRTPITGTRTTLDLAPFANGTYLVRMERAESSATQRLVIARAPR